MLSFREGSAADLPATFALSERAMHASAARRGVIPANRELSDAQIRGDWLRRRAFVEYLAAQPDGRYLIAENGNGPVGYARVIRFGGVEELTELMVTPDNQGQGIGRQLLELAWPGEPSDGIARLVVATGGAVDLSLYLGCGAVPVAGHWELRSRSDRYLANRSHEHEDSVPAVHVLKRERAVSEWKRLEPPALVHERPSLHDFFGRDRTCLAVMDPDGGSAESLCWVSSDGEIGPAVAATQSGLVPVILAALDRVAMTQQPEYLRVFTTTLAWPLLWRLRRVGFTVSWPGWILSSVPLPGLDRYVPTRPPQVL